MKLNNLLRISIILLIILSNIGCDQVSKNIARTDLADDRTISLISHHLTLFRVENTGAFLSLGDQLAAPLRWALFIILPTVVMLAAVVVALRKKLEIVPLVAICFIVGGGLGNIYDRLVRGSVTDFMHIDFGLFQTGIFNMADVSVMVGSFALVVHYYFAGRKEKVAV